MTRRGSGPAPVGAFAARRRRIRGADALRAVVVGFAWLSVGRLDGADDALLVAARRALAAGDAGQALALADGDADAARFGAVRLLAARASLASGDPAGTRRRIGDPRSWPTALRGSAALVLGEAALADGDDVAALAALRAALNDGPTADDVERALALFAETAWRCGDRRGAIEAAEALWRRPACAERAAAGILLARACADTDPAGARAYLAGSRAAGEVTPAQRLASGELLCRLLLADHPGACLVAAERDLAALDATPAATVAAEDASASVRVGTLPLLRALALARLDPVEGSAALAALRPPLAAEPVAVAERARLAIALAAGTRSDRGQRLERAQAELDLGHDDEARALVEPFAADEPAALALLARTRGFAPARWASATAARDPRAAVAVGRAASLAGDDATAWSVLEPALAGLGERADAGLLFWSERAARTAAPERAPRLRERLLAIVDGTVETGVAWAEEAQRLERDGGSAASAWARAARDLPPDHPWAPVAAGRVAKERLAGGDPAGAAAAVAAFAAAGSGGEADRCRFYLIQAWERCGNTGAALHLAQSMSRTADPGHRARLEALCARLAKAESRVDETP